MQRDAPVTPSPNPFFVASCVPSPTVVLFCNTFTHCCFVTLYRYVQAQANASAAAIPLDDQRIVRLVDKVLINQPNR